LRRQAIASVSVAACLALLSCAAPKPPSPPPPAEIWPTTGWQTSTPEAQGIDSATLANAIETLKANNIPIHSLLVERNGAVVLDAYFFPFANNEPHDVASITKSVTSMVVGIAMSGNPAIDLNAPMSLLMPGQLTSDPRKAQITLGELLSMTSGLDCSADQGRSVLAQMESEPHWADYMMNRPLAAEPGTRFDYCGGSMQVVATAVTRITGQSVATMARDDLFAPLGITDVVWPSDPDGVSHGFADLRLEPRDLAKLGYLWLHDGRWQDKQIIPAGYLKEALAPHANVQAGIQYGYGMWLYPGHTPYDFEANGRGGQRITVIPDLNAVIVVTGGGMDANVVTPLVVAAFKSKSPLPADAPGDAQLAGVVSSAAASPISAASAAPPALGYLLASRTWFLSPNPLGVQSLTFSFPSSADGMVRFGYANGVVEDHPIGLDGSPRLSQTVRSSLPVAVGGTWAGDSFELSYDEIARIDAYKLVFVPAADGFSIHLRERSGLSDMMLTATERPPAQPAAGIAVSQR
jgi:CubicO group peptidase (beta-lactamase class C family)